MTESTSIELFANYGAFGLLAFLVIKELFTVLKTSMNKKNGQQDSKMIEQSVAAVIKILMKQTDALETQAVVSSNVVMMMTELNRKSEILLKEARRTNDAGITIEAHLNEMRTGIRRIEERTTQ